MPLADASMRFGAVDITILVVGSLFLLGAVWWGMHDGLPATAVAFFQSGRTKTPWWVLGMALALINATASQVFEQMLFGTRFGVAGAALSLFSVFGFALLSHFAAPRFVASTAGSLPEYMADKYGNIAGNYAVLLGVVLTVAAYLPANISAGLTMLGSVPGLNAVAMSIVLTVLGGISLVVGGMKGLMRLTAFAMLLTVFLGLTTLGQTLAATKGWSRFVDAVGHSSQAVASGVAPDQLRMFDGRSQEYTWAAMLLGLPLFTLWRTSVAQVTLCRVFAVSEVSTVRKACAFASLLTIVLAFVWAIPGLATRLLFPKKLACSPAGCKNPTDAMEVIFVLILPSGMAALGTIWLFALCVVSAGFAWMGSAAAICQAVTRNWPPVQRDRSSLTVARGVVAALMVVSIIMAAVIASSSYMQDAAARVAWDLELSFGPSLAVVILVGMVLPSSPAVTLTAIGAAHTFAIIRTAVVWTDGTSAPLMVNPLWVAFFTSLVALSISLVGGIVGRCKRGGPGSGGARGWTARVKYSAVTMSEESSDIDEHEYADEDEEEEDASLASEAEDKAMIQDHVSTPVKQTTETARRHRTNLSVERAHPSDADSTASVENEPASKVEIAITVLLCITAAVLLLVWW